MTDHTEDTVPEPIIDISHTHWIHLTNAQGRELRLLMGVTVRSMEEITNEDSPAKTRIEIAWPMHMGGLVGMMPGQMPSISLTSLDVLEDIDQVTAAIEAAMKNKRKADRGRAYNQEIAQMRMQQGMGHEEGEGHGGVIHMPGPMTGAMPRGASGGFFFGPDNEDLDLDLGPDRGSLGPFAV